MIRLKVFVSSVQKEMENERQALRAYLKDDALLCRFFDVFLFEDLPERPACRRGLPRRGGLL